jgi:hypothetical protein
MNPSALPIILTLANSVISLSSYLLHKNVKKMHSEVAANLFTVQHLSKVRLVNDQNNPSSTEGGNLGKPRG